MKVRTIDQPGRYEITQTEKDQPTTTSTHISSKITSAGRAKKFSLIRFNCQNNGLSPS